MKILTELQVRHSSFLFFSGGFNSSFADHILSPFLCFLLPVHLIIIPLLAIYCSGVFKISRRFVFPLYIRSSSFEDVISFKSSNSTGAFSVSSNLFNGVSFEWALTHMSFPRILPDSSNFPGAIPKFFSKFDVRMNFISQMFSKLSFKLIFIVGPTSSLFILPEYLNNSWWCFSSSFSVFEDRRRVSLISCSILCKIHGSSLMPSSHNCFRL